MIRFLLRFLPLRCTCPVTLPAHNAYASMCPLCQSKCWDYHHPQRLKLERKAAWAWLLRRHEALK